MNKLPFMLAAMMLVAGAPSAKPGLVELRSVVGRVDLVKLVPLLARGELSLVESLEDGRLRQVTVIGLVEAPPERVWKVLTDYENWPRIISSVAEVEVVKREGKDAVVELEIEVPGSNVEYTRRHRHDPPRRIDIWLEDDEGDITTGGWRWELVPHDGGARTILVNTLFYDAADASWVLRRMKASNPAADHGLCVASGMVAIRSVKKHAEKK
jgi:ribosome-associated toxin RatA of RatAB toxin-antitoxin module